MSEPTPEQNQRRQSLESGEQSERVWTFRGYQLDSGNLTTSLVHLYRGEVARANMWRQRLDSTTNWAVISTGAAFSLVFSSVLVSHAIILLTNLLVTLFLYIEARRYRYYELWSTRIRLLETDFYAAMLVPPFAPAEDWSETLAENLLHPTFTVSMWEAVGRRLRRNYLWIYAILELAWVFNLILRPGLDLTWQRFVQEAAIGGIPGHVVVIANALFYVGVVLIALFTRSLHEATGEVLPRYATAQASTGDALASAGRQLDEPGRQAWFRPNKRRQQLLAQIITSRPEAVAERLLRDLARGVTRLDGTGMYTGKPSPVLLCAVTVTEVAHLKALVADEDPAALVIVTPALEVLGKGFAPLSQDA
jgi:uncharacterized membrane protein